MKKLLSLVAVLLFSAFSAPAQTFVQGGAHQLTDPQTSYSLVFNNPNTAPCTLFMPIRLGSGFVVTDSQNNAWTSNSGLWYTTSCASGPNTITVTNAQGAAFYFQAVYAEFSGVLIPDGATAKSNSSGTVIQSPIISVNARDLVLNYGWNNNSNYYTVTPDPNFTLRGDVNEYLETEVQASSGSVSATLNLSTSDSWNTYIVPFKVAIPPPQPVNVNLSGSLVWDDTTPIQGDIQVQQQTGAQDFTVRADAVPDSTGAIATTISVDVSQPDPLTFKFILIDPSNNIVGVMQQAVPKAMFSAVHGVSNFKIILSKSTLTLAAGTDPGVLQP